jgi:hypothetical protein
MSAKGKTLKAVCLSCGATDKVIMIERHKRGCPYQAYWDAVEALRAMLGER